MTIYYSSVKFAMCFRKVDHFTPLLLNLVLRLVYLYENDTVVTCIACTLWKTKPKTV